MKIRYHHFIHMLCILLMLVAVFPASFYSYARACEQGSIESHARIEGSGNVTENRVVFVEKSSPFRTIVATTDTRKRGSIGKGTIEKLLYFLIILMISFVFVLGQLYRGHTKDYIPGSFVIISYIHNQDGRKGYPYLLQA